jgi:16S rRNA (adenine1518-N6/adenine1519-N6)-dimethyltransferase
LVRPKKHLGQHFLTDPGIARKIAGSIPPEAGRILEIGPGKGALTFPLLDLPEKKLILSEVDEESIAYLRAHPDIPAHIPITGDFLQSDLNTLFDEPFWLAGNFPYNISSQILFRVYESAEKVDGLVGMFQKEVAQRIAAEPGSKTYGILSVLIQAYYAVEYLFTVNEGSFFPPPKVKSAVIRLSRHQDGRGPMDPAFFKQVVKTAFNQRRKTLRNALRSLYPPGYEPDLSWGTRRAEQLSVEDFHHLTAQLKQASPER